MANSQTIHPNDVRFYDLCLFFERLGKVKKRNEKDLLFANFWKQLPINETAFPVMRLFLPLLDKVFPMNGTSDSTLP